MVEGVERADQKKKELFVFIKKQKKAWILSLLIVPFIPCIIVSYLIVSGVAFGNLPSLALLLILINFVYSAFLAWRIWSRGIKLDTAKLAKYNDDDELLFREVVDKKELNLFDSSLLLLFVILMLLIFKI